MMAPMPSAMGETQMLTAGTIALPLKNVSNVGILAKPSRNTVNTALPPMEMKRVRAPFPPSMPAIRVL